MTRPRRDRRKREWERRKAITPRAPVPSEGHPQPGPPPHRAETRRGRGTPARWKVKVKRRGRRQPGRGTPRRPARFVEVEWSATKPMAGP